MFSQVTKANQGRSVILFFRMEIVVKLQTVIHVHVPLLSCAVGYVLKPRFAFLTCTSWGTRRCTGKQSQKTL